MYYEPFWIYTRKTGKYTSFSVSIHHSQCLYIILSVYTSFSVSNRVRKARFTQSVSTSNTVSISVCRLSVSVCVCLSLCVSLCDMCLWGVRGGGGGGIGITSSLLHYASNPVLLSVVVFKGSTQV